jgi:hypothetical protein
VEVRSQFVANRRQIEKQEIGHRRSSIGTPLIGKELVEAIEELFGESNVALRHADGGVDRRVQRPSQVLLT